MIGVVGGGQLAMLLVEAGKKRDVDVVVQTASKTDPAAKKTKHVVLNDSTNAKGTKLLGVKAVLAESFERIHRSNLVGMGVLPLQILDKFEEKYQFIGEEVLYLGKFRDYLHSPNIKKNIKIKKSDGGEFSLEVLSRIDTLNEIDYFKSDGILPHVLNKI